MPTSTIRLSDNTYKISFFKEESIHIPTDQADLMGLILEPWRHNPIDLPRSTNWSTARQAGDKINSNPIYWEKMETRVEHEKRRTERNMKRRRWKL